MNNDNDLGAAIECHMHPVEVNEMINDKYCVVKKLGCGVFSTVWQCLDLYNHQHVALKIVKNTYLCIKAAVNEIKKIKYVTSNKAGDRRSDKFVKFIESFTIECGNSVHICIVLELMQQNVQSYFKMPGKRDMPLIDLKTIIYQILDALDYLHTKCQLIHTDIRPRNIFITDNSELTVKITGLRSACSISGFQTDRYERFLEGPYGAAADVWCTACMAFELATGDSLFVSEESVSLTCVIALLGEIPKHVALSKKRSRMHFTEEGDLVHNAKRDPWRFILMLILKYRWNGVEATKFTDFLLLMLTLDPENRVTPQDCIKHSWIQSNKCTMCF